MENRTVRIGGPNRTRKAYFEDRVFRWADGRLRASAASRNGTRRPPRRGSGPSDLDDHEIEVGIVLIAAAWARAGQGERVLPAGRLHRHALRIGRPVGLSNARGSYPAGRRDYPPYGLAGGYHRHTPATAVGSPGMDRRRRLPYGLAGRRHRLGPPREATRPVARVRAQRSSPLRGPAYGCGDPRRIRESLPGPTPRSGLARCRWWWWGSSGPTR